MLVGIIGSSNLEKAASMIKKTEVELKELYREIGKRLAEAGVEIILVPEGALMEVARSYKQNKGKKFVGAVPREDMTFGIKHLNGIEEIDEEFNCKDWFHQPIEMIKKSDIVLCLGLGTGAFSELVYFKYMTRFLGLKKKLIVLTTLLREGKLPIEIEYDLKDFTIYVNSAEQTAEEILR